MNVGLDALKVGVQISFFVVHQGHCQSFIVSYVQFEAFRFYVSFYFMEKVLCRVQHWSSLRDEDYLYRECAFEVSESLFLVEFGQFKDKIFFVLHISRHNLDSYLGEDFAQVDVFEDVLEDFVVCDPFG